MRLEWLRKARISASLGHRPLDRLRLFVFHTRIALGRGLRLPEPRPIQARLKPDGHRVVISQAGELSVLHDMLVDEEYGTDGDPEVIFDLGANVGFATLFFRRSFPRAQILAVEADPRTFTRLEHNVAGLPGVRTVNCAAADTDGTMTFFSSASSIGSSLVRQQASDEPVEVESRPLTALMEEAGVDRIDLLKVDIEGAEFALLRSAPLDAVDELIVEVHDDLGGEGDDHRALTQLLEGFDVRIQPLPQPERYLLFAKRGPG